MKDRGLSFTELEREFAQNRLNLAKGEREQASANMVEAREWCDQAQREEYAATQALIEALAKETLK